jgi:prefoldin subunit 5
MIKKITILIVASILTLTPCTSKKDKEYYLELTDGTSVLYNSANEKELVINDWTEFNDTNEILLNLEDKEYVIAVNNIENLNNPITNLAHTVPSALKTEEVIEDIVDVQEEYTKLINEKNQPIKNVKQNVEELVEKFDDLREELNEVVEDYVL